jgi:hypothetical protein
MGDETSGRPGGIEDPEGTGRGRCELDEQCERELSADRGRQLSELLACERAPEDGESRGLRGDSQLVRRGRHRSPCLARLEPMLGGDRDDRVTEKVERGTLTPTVS